MGGSSQGDTDLGEVVGHDGEGVAMSGYPMEER